MGGGGGLELRGRVDLEKLHLFVRGLVGGGLRGLVGSGRPGWERLRRTDLGKARRVVVGGVELLVGVGVVGQEGLGERSVWGRSQHHHHTLIAPFSYLEIVLVLAMDKGELHRLVPRGVHLELHRGVAV